MNKRIISFLLSIVMVFLIIPPASYSAFAADFEMELKNQGFTDSYIVKLTELHKKYPKWKFEALMVNENFDVSVSKERQHNGHAQQLIQQYSGNNGKGYYCECTSCYVNGKYKIREGSNWIAASESAVKYYLDPRNFLDEKYIFQFMSTQYDSSQTQAGVEYILEGTWLYKANITYKNENGDNRTYKNSSGKDVKYSKAIMDAAKYSNMSAYYLASKIKQEVGGVPQAQAGGASGTNKTYPGIYNLYNIQANTGATDGLKWAYGDYRWIHVTVGKLNGYIREDLVDKKADDWYTNTTCKLRKGPSTSTAILDEIKVNTKLTYIETVVTSDKDTYNRPWTDPYLSIYNGAKWIANNFGTQFTGYLQKFNVNPASGTSMHNHEYMANVQAAASEALHTYEAYEKLNILSDSITFTIPVFNNMPIDYPTGITAQGTNSGISISWNKVAGAENYRILYKANDESSWHTLFDTTSTNYTWTTPESGTKYTFTVRCLSTDGKTYTSSYDNTGTTLNYAATPNQPSVSNVSAGVKISWNKAAGAEKYRVFYRTTGESSWHKAGDTTSTSYTWTGITSSAEYCFTVRCISADGNTYTSGSAPTSAAIKAEARPAISSVAGTATGIQIKWAKIAGAENYRVFYKANDESSWHKITDTTSTSYVWTKAKSNTKYTFAVRCTDKDGKNYTTVSSAGVSINKYIAAPKISSASGVATGIQIKWGKVAGAAKYRVFYKANGESSWHKAGETTSASFTWTKAKSNTKYTFAVRCIDKDGTNYTSASSGSKTISKYIAAPKISSVSGVATGIQIKWGKVAGAAKYRVFYKANGESSWHKAGETTSASFTWTKAKSNTKYTFAVRCIDKDGKNYTSASSASKTISKYIAAPKIASLSKSSSGIQVKWDKVAGAAKYRVFYKANGESTWHKAGDTTSTSFTWTKAKSNTKYTFAVRCIDKDGKTYTSASSASKSINK